MVTFTGADMSILRSTGWLLLGFVLFAVVAVLFPFAALYEAATRNAHRCFERSQGGRVAGRRA